MVRTSDKKWILRVLGLALAAAVIPACDQTPRTGTPPYWSTQGGQAGTAPGVAQYWMDPNLGQLPPIIGIGGGGQEITFGTVDPMLFPGGTTEASHPVATPTAMDVVSEATIEGAVRNVYTNSTGLIFGGGIGQGQNQGPGFYVGSSQIRAVARAYCKHWSIHTGADPDAAASAGSTPPGAPIDVVWRLMGVGTNPAAANIAEYATMGSGLTAAAAASAIAAAATPYVNGLTQNGWAGAGYWTGGNINYYDFIIFELPTGQVP